jgi:hypothetical protein
MAWRKLGELLQEISRSEMDLQQIRKNVVAIRDELVREHAAVTHAPDVRFVNVRSMCELPGPVVARGADMSCPECRRMMSLPPNWIADAGGAS